MSPYEKLILQELHEIDRKGMPDLITFLQDSDFFTAPASTQYHDSEEGGLAYHSWTVFRLFKYKNTLYKLGLPLNTLRITGILHDICKVNYYIKGIQWYKDETTNWRWAQKSIWKVKDQFPVGHGDKSVIMLQKFMPLKDEEILLIRWHMGAFNIATNFYPQKYAFSDAVTACPAIIALASADWESRLVPVQEEEKDIKETSIEGLD